MKTYLTGTSLALVFLMAICSLSTAQGSGSHPSFTVSGRVLDSDGNPRRGKLHAIHLAIQDGQTETSSSCTTETTDDGQFTCSGLEAGSYILQVLLYASPTEGKPEPLNDPALIAYYPGVLDLDAAEVVSVGSVQQTWADIHVRPSTTFRIAGSLQGIPSTADLRLQTSGKNVLLDTEIHVLRNVQKHIFYADHVPNGRYLLSAVWRTGGIAQRMAAEVTVRDVDSERIALRKVPLISLHGVLSGDSNEVSTLLLYAKNNASPRKIVQVNQGRFTVASVPEGDYYFALPVHSRGFISEIIQGATTTDGSDIRVSDGSSSSDIQVRIDTPGSAIVGTVSAALSDPTNPLRVVAVNEADEHVASSLVDAQGKFSLTGLAAGDYMLLTWPASEDPPYRDRQVLQRLAKYGTTADVDKAAQVTVDDLSPIDPSAL